MMKRKRRKQKMSEILGIDVSNHQGQINWDMVKSEGKVKFAMLRIGVGSDIQNQDDKYFERNVAECERLGIPWGAYIYSYALNTIDAESEKNHILRLLRGKSPSYPIAFDMEDADGYKARHGMPSKETLVDICYTALLGIEQAGYYAALYASKSWLDNQLNSQKLDRFDKWVAQWSEKCTYSKPFGMWQFTSDGTVSGIGGRVDMNKAFYDFPSIINKRPVTEAPKQPTPQPSAQTPKPVSVPVSYTVKSGDTLSEIAARFGLSVPFIQQINGIRNANLINVGQVLKLQGVSVPQPVYYVIKSGDTLSGISAKFGTPMKTIQAWNGIKNANVIKAGKQIRVK